MKSALFLIPLLILPVIINGGIVFGDANFKTAGDWGCSTAAKANVKNVAKDSKSFFGAGDYGYGCSDSVLKTMWAPVKSKFGALGNHECERHQNEKFVSDTFKIKCSRGYNSYIYDGVAVFTINQFLKGDAANSQYRFVSDGVNKVSNMSNIKAIFFIFHEPIYPVDCSGKHCHPDVEKAAFKAKYEPMISDHHIVIIQAHTHLTAFGTINTVRSAVCGGGGEDKTKSVGNGAYTFVTSKTGFCYFHVSDSKITVDLIGTSGTVIHTHTWNN